MEQNIKIATLSGGVSRLPDTKRLPNEAEELQNCVVNPEKSLLKRAPLELMPFDGTAAWEDDVDPDAFWTHIDRDNDEVYLIRVSENLGETVRISNLFQKTVDTVVPAELV